MRNIIILACGGSLIEGLADWVAECFADIGDVSVWCAESPVTKVAEGALALAGDMPDDQFTAINWVWAQMNWALSAFLRGVLSSVRWWHVVIFVVAILSIVADELLR